MDPRAACKLWQSGNVLPTVISCSKSMHLLMWLCKASSSLRITHVDIYHDDNKCHAHLIRVRKVNVLLKLVRIVTGLSTAH